MSKITQLAISRKPVNPKKKKGSSELHIFYTFLPILGSKFKITNATEIEQLFQHLTNRHLTAHKTAQWWHTQKSKIG